MMRLVFILAVLALLVTPRYVGAQDLKSYLYIDEVRVGDGRLIRVVDVSSADTLNIYTEHVRRGRKDIPDENFIVNQADAVVWCYPQVYPHKNHLFPDAEGRIYSLQRRSSITFYTEQGVNIVNEEVRGKITSL